MPEPGKERHVEIECFQETKHGESVCGDDCKIERLENGGRFITALSDGLGSGIKASLLAHMTTTMSLMFAEENMDVVDSAETVMDTLPVCEIRKISYATFTIVDTDASGFTRIIEMGNPEYLHIRNGVEVVHEKKTLVSESWPDRQLLVSEFKAEPEDRILIFSDGVTQAGLGTHAYKCGWRRKGCFDFVRDIVMERPEISARELARMIVKQAILKNAPPVCADDTSCVAIYFRRPRKLLLLTGPPFRPENDCEYARLLAGYDGRKIICGGTSAEIVSRELGRKIKTDWRKYRGPLPPSSEMEGVDLITEGILTLTETAKSLESDESSPAPEPVDQLVEMLHESDVVDIVVGTRVNEAHQDPRLPVDLEIRRNIVRRIKDRIEEKLLKKTTIRYI